MKKPDPIPPVSVLFDLDGTLLDTAPDLAWALNTVLREEGYPERPYEEIRPVVSHGAITMIRFGFGIEPDHPRFAAIRERFLEVYRQNIARHTRLFDGMEELLQTLEDMGITWGVVTNKPAWLTEPLMEALDLTRRAAVIVSGDTTANSKPHPAPLFHACKLTGHDAAHCVYIGDHQRDIEAGHNAGMKTLVALFGYLAVDDQPENWRADHMVGHPREILDYVLAWRNQAQREQNN